MAGIAACHGRSLALVILALLSLALPTRPARALTLVYGTSGADVIDLSTGLGPFHVFGNGGYDQLTGSTDDDLLDGGSGNDQLAGGPGADTLIGGPNDDGLDGGSGNDTFSYTGDRNGYDDVVGGAGLDRINGTAGNDVIGLRSLAGVESIDGVSGNDVIQLASNGRSLDLSATALTGIAMIRGGYGADTVTGSAADDAIGGGPGNDTLDGGPGNDTAHYASSYASYSVTQSAGSIEIKDLLGNEGSDKLRGFEFVRFADAIFPVDELFPPAGNRAPIAADDFAQASGTTAVVVSVLANDTDPDGDALSIQSVTQPSHGTATIGAGGTVVYRSDGIYEGNDRFNYQLVDSRGLADQGTVTMAVTQATSDNQMLDALRAAPEGSWVKLNRNRFQDVWTPKNQRAEVGGKPIGEPRKIIAAWGSMAWDSNRRQLIIWGGGHANYAGNDVYRFDAATLRWERASLPSRVVQPFGDQQYFAADGAMNAPTSSHTYDNQEFLPLLDRFATFGGAKYNAGQIFVLDDGVTKTGPYFWDPSRAGPDMVGGTTGSHVHPGLFPDVIGANMWQNRDSVVRNGVGSARPRWFVNGTTAYAEESGRDVIYLSESPRTGGNLYRYVPGPADAPAMDSWELLGVGQGSYSDQGAGAIDTQRGLYVRTARFSGAYGIVMWSLGFPGATNPPIRFLPRDAAGAFVMSNLHGMDFDSVRQAFVLWDGGPDVWYLRPPVSGSPIATGNWTVVRAPVAAAGPFPDLRDSTGILGKWKYAREYDVMVGLGDSYEGQVWAYKPVGWQPPD